MYPHQSHHDLAGELRLHRITQPLLAKGQELHRILEGQENQRLLDVRALDLLEGPEHVGARVHAQHKRVRHEPRLCAPLHLSFVLLHPLQLVGCHVKGVNRIVCRRDGLLIFVPNSRGHALRSDLLHLLSILVQCRVKHAFQAPLFLFFKKESFLGSVPPPDRGVMRSRDAVLPTRADIQGPDLRVVVFQFEQELELVCIPVLEQTILTRREQVVSLWHKLHLGHRVRVGKEGLVAVAKVHPPDLEILVRRTTC
mmetsp:Transcript_2579/g.4219  ORF Transcript_2579/g.4219 Transcript_2579/m.4219 type:complete len:254 (+) Transcript_2579:222-983(+)